jgi:hypothetical protein
MRGVDSGDTGGSNIGRGDVTMPAFESPVVIAKHALFVVAANRLLRLIAFGSIEVKERRFDVLNSTLSYGVRR